MSFIDLRDSNIYRTVTIGKQTWMAENLRFKTENSFCYENKESNCKKYGRLYTWADAMGKTESECGMGVFCKLHDLPKGICPTGWHTPHWFEFEELFTALGGNDSTAMLNIPIDSTDSTGFSALPGGRYDSGFNGEGSKAYFWSSTENYLEDAYYIEWTKRNNSAVLKHNKKSYANSVRCVKNDSTSEDFVFKTFFGAGIESKKSFSYGRFEARMKTAAIPGSLSPMFTQYERTGYADEPYYEISLTVLGNTPQKTETSIYTLDETTDVFRPVLSSRDMHALEFDVTQDYHLYAIVWTPEYVSWEIDSVEIRRDSIGINRSARADSDQVKFMTEKQHLKFNLWAEDDTSRAAPFTGEGLPIETQIDFVRVYSYDSNYSTFTEIWRDDFDGTTLNQSLWDKTLLHLGKTYIHPANIKVEDGVCKLIMDYLTE